MPWKRYGKCVYKTKQNKKGKTKKVKKQGCSTSVSMAKKYLKALYANTDEIMAEIKDYFRDQNDKDYLEFDDHPLSDVESLMDPDKPAPWDHLTNHEDDEDVDVDIKKERKKY